MAIKTVSQPAPQTTTLDFDSVESALVAAVYMDTDDPMKVKIMGKTVIIPSSREAQEALIRISLRRQDA